MTVAFMAGRHSLVRDVRAIRVRLLLVIPIVLLCLLVSRAHIRAVGWCHDYRLDELSGRSVTHDEVRVSPEAMLRVVGVSRDGDVPVLHLVAGEVAAGTVSVDAGGLGMTFAARVEPGDVIIVDGVNFSGWESIGWSLFVAFVSVGLLCVWVVVSLWRRSYFGYDMAACAGGVLFCCVEAIMFAQVMCSGIARSFLDLAFVITSLADRFVLVLLVPTACAALLACASNVVLARHEGWRPTNLLGLAASVALLVACAAWNLIGNLVVDSFGECPLASIADSALALAISYGLALFVGVSACAWLAARHVPAHPRDYLIVLGCGLMPDGSPTPLLASRLDAALAYAENQRAAGFSAPTFVASGGRGPDEPCSEAGAMGRYLEEHGIRADDILREDRSSNTRENFVRSAELIARTRSAGPGRRIAFVTTNYHVLRSYVWAQGAGLVAEGIAAPTKAYFWPNAFLREFVGLLVARALPLALGYATVALVYLVAEYAILLG